MSACVHACSALPVFSTHSPRTHTCHPHMPTPTAPLPPPPPRPSPAPLQDSIYTLYNASSLKASKAHRVKVEPLQVYQLAA